MVDNQSGYFDYDDPCDYEEWDTWDDLGEGGTCGDPYRSDVTDGGTVFPRGWSGVPSDGAVVALESTVNNNTDRSPLEPISGDIQFSDIDTPMPDNSGVADQSSSGMSDLGCEFNKMTGTPLSGFGESISGDTKFSDTDVPMSNDSGDLCEKNGNGNNNNLPE